MDIKNKVLLSVSCLLIVVLGCGVFLTLGQYKDAIETKDNSIYILENNIKELNIILDKNIKRLKETQKDNEELSKTIKTLKDERDQMENQKKETEKKLKKEKNKKVTRGSGINKESGGGYRIFTATAYCGCRKCNGTWTGMPTASGTNYVAGRTIAVDPSVIPMGKKVQIKGMGSYVAEDTGSAIKGNIIDIYFGSHSEAMKFGRQKVKLKVQ